MSFQGPSRSYLVLLLAAWALSGIGRALGLSSAWSLALFAASLVSGYTYLRRRDFGGSGSGGYRQAWMDWGSTWRRRHLLYVSCASAVIIVGLWLAPDSAWLVIISLAVAVMILAATPIARLPVLGYEREPSSGHVRAILRAHRDGKVRAQTERNKRSGRSPRPGREGG